MIPSLRFIPFPKGPYTSGCVDFMYGRTREGILLRLYYPTQASKSVEKSEGWTSWFLGDRYIEGLSIFSLPSFPSLFSFLFNWQTRGILIPSIWEAPVADGKFPLVIFSHGLAANRGFYSTLCVDLASHGFIVAAVEHRDESACGTFTLSETGEKEWLTYKSLPPFTKEFALRSEQVKIRAKECVKALDVIEKINTEPMVNELSSSFDVSSLKGRINLDCVSIVGHSFGGATALLALEMDKRLRCAVTLDPWMFPLKEDIDRLRGSVLQPTLSIMTEGFLYEKNCSAMNKFMNSKSVVVTVRGTAHQNQSDTPFVLGNLGKLSVWSATTDSLTAKECFHKLAIAYLFKCLPECGMEKKDSPQIDRLLVDSFLSLGLSPEDDCPPDKLKKLIGIELNDDGQAPIQSSL